MTYGLMSARVGYNATAGWNRIKVGAGGFVMAMSISNDGVTKVVATDAGGALVSTNNGDWHQLIAQDRFPAGELDQLVGRQGGSLSVVVAPGDSQRVYLYCAPVPQSGGYPVGYVYKSTDGGLTFIKTAFPGVYAVDTNGLTRMCGPKMAVDPANKDVVYFSTYNAPTGSGIDTGFFCTISNASPAVVTVTNNFAANAAVSFSSSGGTLPTGLTAGTVYYVRSTGLSTSSFQVSATPGGTAINTSSAGSGTPLMYIQDTYVTTDGFATSAVVPNLPRAAQTGPDVGIVFDPTSSVVGSGAAARTQGIYIFSQGNGLYHSANGGTSFSAVGGVGSPTKAMHGKVSLDGVYYAVNDFYSIGGTAGVFRYQSSAWTTITPPTSSAPATIAVSTFIADQAKLFVMESVAIDGGALFVSTDYGANWTAKKGKVRASVAPEPVWMQNCNENGMSVGDITMDPLVQDKLWFCEGIGVWYSTSQSGANVTWNAKSAGIEELVVNQIISPPGGVPVIAFYDRPLFKITDPDTYPSHHGPDETVAINVASSIDWTSTTPGTIVTLCDRFTGDYSGISTDGGGNWTPFSASFGASAPGRTGPGAWSYNGHLSGSIAASSPTTILRVQANDGDVYYSRDGGANWTRVAGSTWGNGTLDAGGGNFTGWHHADYFYRQSVCADRVATDTFYLANAANSSTGGGLWKVTFPAGVFTAVRQSTRYSDSENSLYNLLMSAVPGYSGHVFITAGEGQSTSTGLQRTTDGCSNLQQIANIGEVYAFGLGAIKPGNDYPSIYVVGYKSSVYGIWRGDGNASDWAAGSGTGTTVTWTNLGGFPLGCTAKIKSIAGDGNTWGRCYVGTDAGGSFYYRP